MTEQEVREMVARAFELVLGERSASNTIPDTLNPGTGGDEDRDVGSASGVAREVPALVQQLLVESRRPAAPTAPMGQAAPSAEGDSGFSEMIREASSGASSKGTNTTSPKAQPAREIEPDDSTAKVVARTALSVLSLGTAPLISGILRLFGGGSKQEPPPLFPFSLPPSLQFEAANPHGNSPFQTAMYGQQGLPRIPDRGEQAERVFAAPGTTRMSESAAAPRVTIQVNAMDSKSFLDHSNEIAQAVREAMLNMHSINDVVSDF